MLPRGDLKPGETQYFGCTWKSIGILKVDTRPKEYYEAIEEQNKQVKEAAHYIAYPEIKPALLWACDAHRHTWLQIIEPTEPLRIGQPPTQWVETL